ncbi:huntingtin-interacting protein 1 isoform X2 [Neocloeon triangulifer]|uniref:huntingtin-interacting protein 1 isoform X2 n=1 Tax=Neocloeon triangulifer TaxID=2078957 RepID=UPI00286ED793|nr:huntingtin-interacting protein 1 isoform X2 [Neocloeon triangulifer]
MSSIQLPKVLQNRKTSLELERENFEKFQALSISKAVNQTEQPIKEKHVRSTIIGTFHEKGAGYFWNVGLRMPVQDNPIVAWKFCHLLHKVLREGHPNVLVQSQKHKGKLADFGKLWGHLKEGYGILIARYCHLLITKLKFHQQNPKFPGNLLVTPDELMNIGENDINNYFQMAVEMFEYLDDIVSLQNSIFGSLDMSRSNSMTSSGQCRLAPLIPCIQDSSQLYDYCVKMLFKLHGSLPPDVVSGHRERFLKIFKDLKQFYINASNLQYFKNLIQIPLLPDSPPNFLLQSDLRSYVTPVVVMPEDDHDSLETASFTEAADLVDLTPIQPLPPVPPQNGRTRSPSPPAIPPLPDIVAQRDLLIQQLQAEILRLKGEIQKLLAQYEEMYSQLQDQIIDLETKLAQKESELAQERQTKEELLVKAEAAATAEEIEKKAKEKEEKFQKLKDVYGNLRKEHINLLRQKAEVEKQLNVTRQKAETFQKGQTVAEEKLQAVLSERSTLEEGLQQTATEKDSAIAELERAKETAVNETAAVQSKLERALNEKSTLEAELHDLLAQKLEAEEKLEESEQTSKLMQSNLKAESDQKIFALLEGIVKQAEKMLQNAVNEMDNPALAAVTCSSDYFKCLCGPTDKILEQLGPMLDKFRADQEGIDDLANSITQSAHNLSWLLLHGKALSQTATDIEIGDSMLEQCRFIGTGSIQLMSLLKNKESWGGVSEALSALRSQVQSLGTLSERLEGRGTPLDTVGDLLESELLSMEKAIDEAASKIEDMLTKSKAADSGIKLEVNSKILDACTSLMAAIRELVIKSRVLQEEIVAQSKGSASVKEFYKRNSQWTEGLISAAKTVAIGAHFLVEAANEAVTKGGKLELLVVASQQIAAGTAQLVVASRVKADRKSGNLEKLSTASRGVSTATGAVVAAAKACRNMVETADVLDVSGITLHAAKRLEMDSQVRVLELESSLQQERLRLAALRRHHYQLAGESEGWEKKDIPE